MESNQHLMTGRSEENGSTEKLLAGEPFVDDQYVVPHKKHKRWLPTAVIPLLFAFLVVYSISLVLLVRGSIPHCQSQNTNAIIYSPVRDIISKKSKTLDNSVLHGNIFKGPPRPELDYAWKMLLINANVRVSKKELEKAGKDSIPLEDGSGYYAILDVYHQLHCLKYIRHFVFGDYYNDTHSWTPTHVDHCIDSIRQNLMCNADLSLMTFRWVDDDLSPKPNFKGQHECVNWQRIEDWAAPRSFNPDDPKLLIHPKLRAR